MYGEWKSSGANRRASGDKLSTSATRASNWTGAMRRSHRSTEVKRRQAHKGAESNPRFAGLPRSSGTALLFQAWARGALSENQVIALASVADHPASPIVIDRRALERVLAAMAGALDADTLNDSESLMFMELFTEYMSKPNPETVAHATMMRSEGGYVGLDENGRLVRTLPGGDVELIGEPPNGGS